MTLSRTHAQFLRPLKNAGSESIYIYFLKNIVLGLGLTLTLNVSPKTVFFEKKKEDLGTKLDFAPLPFNKLCVHKHVFELDKT